MPLLLDCGTNNQKLLDDPFYIGLRQKCRSTEELDDFVDDSIGKALAGLLTEEERNKGMVFLPQSNILWISTQLAVRVAEAFFKSGLACENQPEDIPAWIAAMQYQPIYPTWV